MADFLSKSTVPPCYIDIEFYPFNSDIRMVDSLSKSTLNHVTLTFDFNPSNFDTLLEVEYL